MKATLPSSVAEKEKSPRVFIILEAANLETIVTKRGIELINCDDHQKHIAKVGKKLEDYRPDVTHQCLLMLLDSPLNQAGLLQIYIRTNTNVLIEVSPMLRVPRTYKKFAAMMAQCLTKLKIRAATGSAVLLNVIKNDVRSKLPLGTEVIGTSSKAELLSMA